MFPVYALIFGVVIIALVFIFKLLNDDIVVTEETPSYQIKKYFFTQSEGVFFSLLEEGINHQTHTVFPKVRLADFVEITSNDGYRNGDWNKIKSKHVDFLIYNTEKKCPVLAIELDGASHTGERMEKSDDFKNALYPSINLELIRVKAGSDFKSEIQSIVQKLT